MVGFLPFVRCLVLFRLMRWSWPVAIIAALLEAFAGVFMLATVA